MWWLLINRPASASEPFERVGLSFRIFEHPLAKVRITRECLQMSADNLNPESVSSQKQKISLIQGLDRIDSPASCT